MNGKNKKSKNSTYKCPHCPKTYASGQRVMLHVRDKHTNAVPDMSKEDPVNPTYYKGREVMDIINRFGLSFCVGTVVKYVLRAKEKNGVEDLIKAVWYLEEEIELQGGRDKLERARKARVSSSRKA